MEQADEVMLLEARLAYLVKRASAANEYPQSGGARPGVSVISRRRERSLELRIHMLKIYIEDLEGEFRRLGW
jgi:hypothetical protein